MTSALRALATCPGEDGPEAARPSGGPVVTAVPRSSVNTGFEPSPWRHQLPDAVPHGTVFRMVNWKLTLLTMSYADSKLPCPGAIKIT